jgi:UDP:flavonoid glycosyltransferase YjiC (YdhE family)
VDFPWERLDPDRPLVYASMGTLQNGILRTFRMIAEACAGLGVQLVISLGGDRIRRCSATSQATRSWSGTPRSWN